MPQSQGVKNKEEDDKKEQQDHQQLNENEQGGFDFYIKRCTNARDNRNQRMIEFDDMNYEQDYQLNKQAMNTYLRRKKNDDEVRVNTATLEKKIESIHNELLSLNLTPEVRAFDLEDNELVGLGKEFNDIVKRTNEIEKDEDVWVDIVQELITQRAVFVEEIYVDKEVQDRKRSFPNNEEKDGEFNEQLTRQKQIIQRAEKRLISGLQIYLGDISLPAYKLNEQPYLIKYERKTIDEARTIYGNWDKWDFVKPGMPIKDKTWYDGQYQFRMNRVDNDEVEIIHYMSYPDDEYMIIINGVMMLDVGTALPWEYEGYNLTMTTLKSMSRHLCYGKPLTASAKTLQSLENETFRQFIRKMRQSIEPPLGVKKGKIFSKDIWSAGAVTQGVGKDDFTILNENNKGVTTSEFQMMELINKTVDEFIGSSDLLQGQTEKGLTATQAVAQLKQALKQLGLAVLAISRLKRDLTFLRIYNVLENYTEPVRRVVDGAGTEVQTLRNQFRQFTIIDGDFEGGETGKKIIQFTEGDLSPEKEQEVFDFEESEFKKGRPTRLKFINVVKLRAIKTIWFVAVNPENKEGTALDKILLQDEINQAVVISQITRTPLNSSKLINKFERVWQSKDLFQKEAPVDLGVQMPGGENEVGGQAQGILDQLGDLGGGATRPTVNTALGQTQ